MLQLLCSCGALAFYIIKIVGLCVLFIACCNS